MVTLILVCLEDKWTVYRHCEPKMVEVFNLEKYIFVPRRLFIPALQ
jgi:hypothetical protein